MPADRHRLGDPAKRNIQFKWASASEQLTTDLLDLVASRREWRHTFFSTDAGKGVRWREARDMLLELFAGQRERRYMESLREAGLIREERVERAGDVKGAGGVRWVATVMWSANRSMSNPVDYRLKTLLDKYRAMQEDAELLVDGGIRDSSHLSKQHRDQLLKKLPWFWQIHNLVHNHPRPAIPVPTLPRPGPSSAVDLKPSSTPRTREGSGPRADSERNKRARSPATPKSPENRMSKRLTSGAMPQTQTKIELEDQYLASAGRSPLSISVPKTPNKRRSLGSHAQRSVAIRRPALQGSIIVSDSSDEGWDGMQVSESSDDSDSSDGDQGNEEEGAVGKDVNFEEQSRGSEDVGGNSSDVDMTDGSIAEAAGHALKEESSLEEDVIARSLNRTVMSVESASHLYTRESLAERLVTPVAPIVPVKNEPEPLETGSPLSAQRIQTAALSSKNTFRYSEPLAKTVGTPEHAVSGPKSRQYDLIRRPTGSADFGTRLSLSTTDGKATVFSVPADISMTEILAHARRNTESPMIDARFVLHDEQRASLMTNSRIEAPLVAPFVKRQKIPYQSTLYYQLAFLRPRVMESGLALPAAVFLSPSSAGDPQVRSILYFLQHIKCAVHLRPPTNKEKGIYIDGRIKDFNQKLKGLEGRIRIGPLGFWRAFDAYVHREIPNFEKTLSGGKLTLACLGGSTSLKEAAVPRNDAERQGSRTYLPKSRSNARRAKMAAKMKRAS